jgi:hypothetical protein
VDGDADEAGERDDAKAQDSKGGPVAAALGHYGHALGHGARPHSGAPRPILARRFVAKCKYKAMKVRRRGVLGD